MNDINKPIRAIHFMESHSGISHMSIVVGEKGILRIEENTVNSDGDTWFFVYKKHPSNDANRDELFQKWNQKSIECVEY